MEAVGRHSHEGSSGAAADRVQARGVGVEFGGVKALSDIDLVLDRGEILGLIGPNGAGKTTLVNVLSGFQRPTAGSVMVGSEDVTGRSADHVARAGVARTFQSVRLFRTLSVLENLEAGAVGLGASRRRARAQAWDLLARMNLEHRAHAAAGALPYGEERLIGILRALALRARFLLLDEPAAGLSEHETDALLESIGAIRTDFECGILLIEHDMRLVMGVCERLHVLDYGRTLAVGDPATVRNDPAVIAAYLGPREDHVG